MIAPEQIANNAPVFDHEKPVLFGSNKIKIKQELDNNWEVLTEAVQTLMRYEGIPDAYEQLKNLSRGSKLNKETYISFIKTLAISEESKNKLLQLKPSTYIGFAEDLSKN